MIRRIARWALKALFRLCLVACVLAGIVLLTVYTGYRLGKSEIEEEWDEKVAGRRSPEEMRGLIDNMIYYRDVYVPKFIPMGLWDDELCAAAVINAASYIIGEEVLKTTSAWTFSQVNKDKIKLMYDRSEDFEIQGNKIVELKDSSVCLSCLLHTVGRGLELTQDAIYIVGYHYKETRSDRIILRDNADLNSHLMLILGRHDRTWWGYHLVHDLEKPADDPFLIQDVGEDLPPKFDVVYIWQVKGTKMPRSAVPVMLFSNTPRYSEVQGLIGRAGKGRFGYMVDTALTKRFTKGDHFPHVLPISGTIIEAKPPDIKRCWHGQIIGLYNGVSIHCHLTQKYTKKSDFGQEFQCPEFVNRYYKERLGHRNMTGTGHADTYYYASKAKGLLRYPNGSDIPPQVDDILVFDPEGKDDSDPGHVAIVYRVTNKEVCLVHQNWRPWRLCLPLEQKEGGWYVGSIQQDLPCVGWVRREG